jgi:hypothetical protein
MSATMNGWEIVWPRPIGRGRLRYDSAASFRRHEAMPRHRAHRAQHRIAQLVESRVARRRLHLEDDLVDEALALVDIRVLGRRMAEGLRATQRSGVVAARS